MRRLSIIDLQRGHQPIGNEEQTAWIVFNGEIYNHRDRGCRPGPHVPESERHRGDPAPLRGRRRPCGGSSPRNVRLCRVGYSQAATPAGAGSLRPKPLFYSFNGSRLLFASEIKAILAAGKDGFALDPATLDDYLTLRFVPSPGTMLKGISKLPPGHLLVLDASGVGSGDRRNQGEARLEVRRYWRLRFLPKRKLRERDAVEEVRARVIEAVESHLISDVPVGAYLSGGMDSSLIVAIISRLKGEKVSTFSIGVAEQDFNELPSPGK